jgi:hypothetical protein
MDHCLQSPALHYAPSASAPVIREVQSVKDTLMLSNDVFMIFMRREIITKFT